MKVPLHLPLVFLAQFLSAQNFTEGSQSPPFEGVKCGSVAFSDVDGDGDSDLLITGLNISQMKITKLYINDGGGNFTEKTGTPFEDVSFSSVAFSDVDGDGDSDLLITGGQTHNVFIAKLYINDGGGNFTEKTGTPFEGVREGSVAFSDVDGDGDSDLLITGEVFLGRQSDNHRYENIAKLYINDGGGNFTEKSGTLFDGVVFSSVAFTDVDGDGDSDLLITGWNNSRVNITKLYLNDGMGNFTEKTDTSFDDVRNSSVAFSDVDGDGDSDLLITGQKSFEVYIAKLYINDGGGNFTEKTGTSFEGVWLSSVAFTDVDGDGDSDLQVTGGKISDVNIAKLYINDGGGNFTEKMDTPFEGIRFGSVAFSDVDGDGDSDLLIMGMDTSGVHITKLYVNEGTVSSVDDRDNIIPFDFMIYPNPTHSHTLNLLFESKTYGQMHISMYDLHGRLLMKQQRLTEIGKQTVSMDVSHLPQGAYNIQLDSGKRGGSRMVLIQ